MADQKLSDLTAATTVDPADLVYTAQGGASKKATRELLQTYNAGTLTTDKKALDLSATWNSAGTTFTGIKLNVTDTASASGSKLIDLQVGAASQFAVDKSNATGVTCARLQASNRIDATNLIAVSSGANITPTTYGLGVSGTMDTILTRDAADTLAQRRTTNVQAFRLYRTFTDASNLAYTAAKQDATTGYILDSVNAGTGTEPTNLLDLQLNGSSKFKVDKSGNTTFAASSSVYLNGGTSLLISAASTTQIYLSVGSSRKFAFTSNEGVAGASLWGNAMAFGWSSNVDPGAAGGDLYLYRDAANTLAQRNSTNAQESRVYASYTSATNFQRTSIKTVREVSSALSGASYTTTIAIPAYANLIGVTTRVTTAVTGATSYSVGDGSDVDLWGATTGVTLGSQSQTSDFTAVGAVGAAATSRTITLTANGSNFTGGVVEICAHYIFTEAD